MGQNTPVIQEVGEAQLDEFFRYLKEQLSENGDTQTGYFLPLPKGTADLPIEKKRSFREGRTIPVGAPGWRRLWVARTADGTIAGHIDFRGHGQPFTAHRCLLGMGVHRRHRRRGLGALLLAHGIHWAQQSTMLQWIDLQVLSTNERALRLYQRAGFTKTGEVADMFQIDGRYLSEITMTKKIRAYPIG